MTNVHTPRLLVYANLVSSRKHISRLLCADLTILRLGMWLTKRSGLRMNPRTRFWDRTGGIESGQREAAPPELCRLKTLPSWRYRDRRTPHGLGKGRWDGCFFCFSVSPWPVLCLENFRSSLSWPSHGMNTTQPPLFQQGIDPLISQNAAGAASEKRHIISPFPLLVVPEIRSSPSKHPNKCTKTRMSETRNLPMSAAEEVAKEQSVCRSWAVRPAVWLREDAGWLLSDRSQPAGPKRDGGSRYVPVPTQRFFPPSRAPQSGDGASCLNRLPAQLVIAAARASTSGRKPKPHRRDLGGSFFFFLAHNTALFGHGYPACTPWIAEQRVKTTPTLDCQANLRA